MNDFLKISAIIGILALAGCKQTQKRTNEDPPRVAVAFPVTDSVTLSQSYPATLRSTSTADVVARVNGTIKQQLFTAGENVRAGQPLYVFDSSSYRDAVIEAEAALETAQAQYDYALRQNQAMQEALKADAVSRMNVIQAESNLRQAEAAIRTAQAKLRDARHKLSHCTVTAPISGKISKSELDVGSYVSGADAPVTLTTIYDDSNLYAEFSIPTDRYLAMTDTRQGDKVDYNKVPVTLGDTITGTYFGKLAYISPDVSSTTGTVDLRIRLENINGELRDGMYVTVNLPYAVEPKAMLINDAAISTDQLGKFVYTVNDSNRVVYTPIEVGPLFHDTLRIVTKGLTPTDRYVTTALLKVRDGMPVSPY